jgi:hypothetical protein
MNPLRNPDAYHYWNGEEGYLAEFESWRPPLTRWIHLFLQHLGVTPDQAMLLQVGAHIASGVLLYSYWRRLGGSEQTCVIALTAFLLSPTLLSLSTSLDSHTILVLIIAIFLYSDCSLLIGLGALCRPTMLPYLIFAKYKIIGCSIALVWIGYLFCTHGRIVPISTSPAVMLYLGNVLDSEVSKGEDRDRIQQWGSTMTEIEFTNKLRGDSIKEIVSHPIRSLVRWSRNTLEFWFWPRLGNPVQRTEIIFHSCILIIGLMLGYWHLKEYKVLLMVTAISAITLPLYRYHDATIPLTLTILVYVRGQSDL